MSLSGKICMITGANSGLGLAVAKKIAEQGAETILVCRNQENGEQAVRDVKEIVPDANVKLMICDLSSMKSTRNFIREFQNQYERLDILFNNAAIMKQKRTITEDGLEMMFQVNYISPFILMNGLLSQLKKDSHSLILNNGRPSNKLKIDLDDLQFSKSYQMYNSFFKTKLCLMFANLDLADKLKKEPISVVMADPGPFKSSLVRDVPLMGWLKNLFSAPVDKAADNILYVMTSAMSQDLNGKVFKEKGEWPIPEYWQDKGVRQDLWNKTQELI